MTTHVVCGVVSPSGVPALIGNTMHAGQAMSESGSSTGSTTACTANPAYAHSTNNYAWRVEAISAAIYAASGDADTVVSVANGVYIPVGSHEYITTQPGHKVYIITA